MDDESFRLDSIEFGDDRLRPEAMFVFGPAGLLGARNRITAEVPSGPDIEEALAIAAESAAADLHAWAKEAEDLAARTRAGGLRQPLAAP